MKKHTQRHLDALALRGRGMSFEQIGAALNISKETAWRLIAEMLEWLERQGGRNAD